MLFICICFGCTANSEVCWSMAYNEALTSKKSTMRPRDRIRTRTKISVYTPKQPYVTILIRNAFPSALWSKSPATPPCLWIKYWSCLWGPSTGTSASQLRHLSLKPMMPSTEVLWQSDPRRISTWKSSWSANESRTRILRTHNRETGYSVKPCSRNRNIPHSARDYHSDVVQLLYMFHKHKYYFHVVIIINIITLMFYHSLYNSCPIVHLLTYLICI